VVPVIFSSEVHHYALGRSAFLPLGINGGNVKKIELFHTGRRRPGKPHPPLSPRERVVEDPVRQEGRKLFYGVRGLY
jgi:hypothetical protein